MEINILNKPFNFGSGDNVYFTSDTHWGHSNIIKFCNRPFNSVEEMNEALIKNWNDTVEPNDIIFHLGDFALGGSQLWNEVLNALNGHIYLILGNHDLKNIREGYMNRFELVIQQMQIQIGGKSVYLNHYPFLCYGGSYRGKDSVWQLFGHVHSSSNSSGKDDDRLKMLFPFQYDVGVDNNDFKPISWEQVSDIITKQYEQSKISEL